MLFSHNGIRYLFSAMIKVAVGIIEQDGSVLVCQRKHTAPYPLKWEFPGGKIEDAEAPHEGLQRELKEELGIEARIGQLYHRQRYVYPDSGAYEILYYQVTSFEGTVETRAFEDIRWTRIEELAITDMLEGNREVVKKLMTGRGKLAPR
jgi:mutator protein MutT